MSNHSGGKAIEILLVEDNEGDARLVREILRDRPEIDIHMVDRLSLGVEYLRSHETDVVLLDLGLPDSQGLDSLRTLSGAVPHVPVIVITGQDDEEIGRTAIRQGAQDYLVKPVTPGRMLARILLFAVERKRMEEREKHLNAVLRSIRAVNKLISREKHRDRLIQTACDRLTDARGINGIWIVLTDRLPGRVEAAQKGFKEEAFSALVGIFRKGGMPPCFRRAQTGSGIIVNRNPPEVCEGCPMANAYGRAAALSTRIEHEGRYFGCMGFSVPQEYVVDEEEKLLLEEIAEDIAFGLNGIETEAARQKSEQTLRAILDSAADGMLLVEMETRLFVHSNKAISRMLGYNPEEIRGLSIADIHPAEDLPRVLEQFEKQFRGEITVARDIPMKRKDGSVFYADINSAPVELEGRPYLLGIFRDITERKLMEASLRQSEERYRSIFQGAAEGILINEIETLKIKYVNPAMCQMLGYTEDELKRMTVRDIHPDNVVRRAISEFEAHERGNIPMMGQDVACLKKDGTIIYTDLAATLIFIDGSAHSVVFFLDITERKKAEEEKKKIEAQLFQSQKLEAVGRLTGGIAHDFNNILTAIIGNAEIILADLPKDDPTREGVEEIRAAGNRAASLTGQLLAFSRKQILQPTVMSLNETVRDMDRMLRRIIGEDVELRTILASDLGQVEADAGQVEQVIMNLAVNARDAMPRGGKITIETGNVDLDEGYVSVHIAVTPGPYVMLSVSDTGVGMTREVQEQIFDPFFTTKEKGKGTGLGLSMVYGIVKQNKGNIWVYSEPGRGTTFKVYLPRVEKSICATEKKDKKAGAVTGSETILLVEDDEMVRNFTARVLKGYGYRVLIAADGGEAVRISGDHEGPIHLMLTDVVMPGMRGQELEERLRASRPGIKVLYMSGYTDDAIVHHGVLDPGKAFLQKPFTLDSLGRKVREVLGD